MRVRFDFSTEMPINGQLMLLKDSHHNELPIDTLTEITENALKLFEDTLMKKVPECKNVQIFHFEAVK